MSADLLHLYQCPNCQTTMTVTVRSTYGDPYLCPIDRCYMRYVGSEEVKTEAQRAQFERGRVLNPHESQPSRDERSRRMKRCDECRRFMEGEIVSLSGVGDFCSETCANEGARHHEAVMSRVAELRAEQPYVRFYGR